MSKIPTGTSISYEYIPYFKHTDDKTYLTSGSYATLKLAKDCIKSKEDIIEWKIVKVTKVYEYSIVSESK